MGKEQIPISHLQFVDDTILFLDGEEDRLRNLLSLLHCFEMVSRMKINWDKSCLVAINSLPHGHLKIGETLNWSVRPFPIDYFGNPLGGNSRKRDFWLPVIEKSQKKFALLKYFSFGGRINLIKAALSNLPIYFLSVFKIPIRVVKEIETLQKRFLWRGNSESKPHLIKWEIVSHPKEKGRLGIGGHTSEEHRSIG